MKIKNISLIVLSLLLGLSALHAVPTDPGVPPDPSTNNPGTTTNSNTGDSVVLTSDDTDKPVQLTTAQTLSILLPSTENSYTFSDTWLIDVARIPCIFTWIGVINSKDDTTTDCVNMAIKRNDPIVFQGSSFVYTYIQNPADSEDPNAEPDLTYYPVYFYNFSFKPNVPGTTTLTFSDGPNLYTYPITVVAAP